MFGKKTEHVSSGIHFLDIISKVVISLGSQDENDKEKYQNVKRTCAGSCSHCFRSLRGRGVNLNYRKTMVAKDCIKSRAIFRPCKILMRRDL